MPPTPQFLGRSGAFPKLCVRGSHHGSAQPIQLDPLRSRPFADTHPAWTPSRRFGRVPRPHRKPNAPHARFGARAVPSQVGGKACPERAPYRREDNPWNQEKICGVNPRPPPIHVQSFGPRESHRRPERPPVQKCRQAPSSQTFCAWPDIHPTHRAHLPWLPRREAWCPRVFHAPDPDS